MEALAKAMAVANGSKIQQLVNDTGKEILLNGTEGKGPLDTYAAQIAAFLPSQRRQVCPSVVLASNAVHMRENSGKFPLFLVPLKDLWNAGGCLIGCDTLPFAFCTFLYVVGIPDTWFA